MKYKYKATKKSTDLGKTNGWYWENNKKKQKIHNEIKKTLD